jgi:CHASE2 domain-containing sensor protein
MKIKSKTLFLVKVIILIILFLLFVTGIILPLIPGLFFFVLFLILLTTFHEKIELYIDNEVLRYPKIYKKYSKLKDFVHRIFK